MEVGRFDPQEFLSAKEAARRADDDAIEAGRVSEADMRRKNEFLQHYDLSKAHLTGNPDAVL